MINLLRIAYRNSVEAKRNTVIVIILELISIYSLFKLNMIYGNLYQAIQDYNIPGIWKSIGTFSAIAGGLVFINGYLGYFINKLAFNIRSGLTIFLLDLQISSTYGQQVQEDIRKFGESSVEMAAAILRAAIKLPLFLGIIMSLTQVWIGLVVVGAVVLGTVATKYTGRRITPLQAEQEGNEAEFRKQITLDTFSPITVQFKKINNAIKVLSFTQSGIGQTFALLPFILLMPLYISHTVTLGAFMQSTRALSTIIDSLGVLIDNRMLLVNLETCLMRLSVIVEFKPITKVSS